MDNHIDLDVSDGVAWLTFNRPEKRNAFTAGMWELLATHLSDLGARDDVRILAVSGTGGSFSAGADLNAVKDASGVESPAYRALAEEGLRSLREFPRPSVAFVDGPCIGAGCLIALSCDVRFASPRSVFAVPAVKYGLHVERNGLAKIVQLVGAGQASRFLLTSASWPAAVAAEHGLIEVCSDDAGAQVESYVRVVAASDATVTEATREEIQRVAARTA